MIDGEFNPKKLNEVWCGDITYVKTSTGWVYLDEVIDLFNREVYRIAVEAKKMNTKEVCIQLSVTPKMLRVYESQKLIHASRTENGYRDYSLDDILQIQVIVLLRDLGFSLKEIKKVLCFKKNQKDYLDHFYIQLKAVEAKINEWNAVKTKINGMINDVLRGNDINDGFPQQNRTSSDSKSTSYESMINRWNFDLMAVDYVNRYLNWDTGYLNSIKRTAEYLKPMICGRTILDVGGGTCNLWQEFQENTQLTVIDKSLQMIFAAKENIPWANYILEDILQINPNGMVKYDVVVSTFTLHHISYDQQEKAIKNIIDFCSEGGSVLLVDRSFRNQNEKENKERELEEAGNLDFLEIIQSEYYLIADQIESYICYLGYESNTLFFEDEIWGFLINKKQS